ncbi:MAG: single-stranded DNA-binding protein [Sandaracinaceae bacterium]|nr:single-stranded DNA-binding protein [Sandaracinaceae bacterium]MCC6877131.1 single-stranded DNA-binding protein [Sandaracinaceae bacterium]
MKGLNKAILIGNLASQPELRMTKTGRPVLKMRLATVESFADAQGTERERTAWHTVVVWGPRGEALARILKRGSRVGVEGRITYNQWEDRDGKPRTDVEIVAVELLLLGSDDSADTQAA